MNNHIVIEQVFTEVCSYYGIERPVALFTKLYHSKKYSRAKAMICQLLTERLPLYFNGQIAAILCIKRESFREYLMHHQTYLAEKNYKFIYQGFLKKKAA